MTNVLSKVSPVDVICTCKNFQHPWTDSCASASAGLLLAAIPYCLRVYTAVYVVSMVMKHKIPSKEDLKRMVLGILRSTAFLSTNAFTFILYNCLIRNLLGYYTKSTVAFWPTFLSAFTAILVERPQRRPLLALYVANVATETLWNMGVARGWVHSIPHGQTLIFGVSVSILLYLFRLGLHKTAIKDPLFGILRIFVGKTEEGPVNKSTQGIHRVIPQQQSRPSINILSIQGLVAMYGRFIEALKKKHPSCNHKENCIPYAVMGGLKPFIGGVTLQVLLKMLLNVKKIIQMNINWRKTVFNKDSLKLGIFLGSFSFLYKAVSCSLRHGFGRDDPLFAIPAGLIGSIAFTQYPDNTVALYVMWKMLQLVYNMGAEKGLVPYVPGFLLILYSTCTAILFHAGILEPNSLRPSYYKFLQQISGERLSRFNLQPFESFGLESSKQAKEVIERLKIVTKTSLPKFSFAS